MAEKFSCQPKGTPTSKLITLTALDNWRVMDPKVPLFTPKELEPLVPKSRQLPGSPLPVPPTAPK